MLPGSGFYFWRLFLWEQLLQVGNGAARVNNGTARLCEKQAAEAQCVVLGFKTTCRRGVFEERLLSGRVLLGVLQLHGLCSTVALRTCLWPACVQECSGCTFLCEAARALSAECACEAALGWTFEIRCTESMSPVPQLLGASPSVLWTELKASDAFELCCSSA